MTYSYDRTAAGSATPTIDALVRKDLYPELSALVRSAMSAADRIEFLAPVPDKQDTLKGWRDKAVSATYKMFNLFRPFLNGWEGEVRAIQGTDGDKEVFAKIVKEVKGLAFALAELNKAYAYVSGPLDMGDVVQRSDQLARSAATVRTLYKQLYEAYWTR